MPIPAMRGTAHSTSPASLPPKKRRPLSLPLFLLLSSPLQISEPEPEGTQTVKRKRGKKKRKAKESSGPGRVYSSLASS